MLIHLLRRQSVSFAFRIQSDGGFEKLVALSFCLEIGGENPARVGIGLHWRCLTASSPSWLKRSRLLLLTIFERRRRPR